ncbi:thiolase family protein [Polaromonas hydrogenivorans]|uniref:Thiolase family protein n=1 Tax=Polaromonas hydrogenivorans TaxID=335476 RepID=A0AAU7M060_9BURK
MSVAVVSGIGEVSPSRRSGKSVETLILSAISGALADAGLRGYDIDAVVTESSLTPSMAPLDRIGAAAGLINVRMALQSTPVGAGILSAVGTAFELVSNNKADHCLVYFGVDWGTTPSGPTEYHERMPAKKLVEHPAGFAGAPLYFAAAAMRYQYVYNLSDSELQDMLWSVVESTLVNASRNPCAQNGRVLSKEEYLNKAFIAEPLRSADCSLLSDGAVAIIISRRDKTKVRNVPVTLEGWAYDMESIPDMDFYTQSPWLPRLPAASRASGRAFQAASLTPQDIDVYEIYDCFSIAVVLQLEAIGLCEPGEGRYLCANGALRFDGRLPTNTHGGLMGHGYLLGAGHVVEAIRQLRHEAGERQVRAARTAFVGAGPGRQYTALIFGRMDG